jgi:hypothetical protein
VGLPPSGGLLHAGSWGEENEEVEEAGDAKTSPEVAEEGQEEAEAAEKEGVALAAVDEAAPAVWAKRVSTARQDENGAAPGALGATMVDPDPQEIDEEMEPHEPRAWCRGLQPGREEKEEDLGICDNSPTKPGVLPL